MGTVSYRPASSGAGPVTEARPVPTAAAPAARSGRSALRELPMVLLATALTAVLPALSATWILPSRDAAAIVASAILAMALAALATRLGAAAWSRWPATQDLLFADLMLWASLRRRWTERRLAAAQRRVFALDATTTTMPLGALTRMGRLLEVRDIYTYGHSRRVARHAATIARAMHLGHDEVECIRRAALVHDIGKIYTPRDILDKPGRLSDTEFDIIKRHPDDGADLVSHLGEPEVVAIVRHHHERLDGRGYPAGLAGQEIPLGARIIAVADTFDALTSTRSYRRSSSHKRALKILAAEAGTQLDADAVAVFLRHYSASRPAALAAAATSGGERLLASLGGASAGLGSGAGAIGAAATATAVLALGTALQPVSSYAVPKRAVVRSDAAPPPALPSPRHRSQVARTVTAVAQQPRARRTPPAAHSAPTPHGRPAEVPDARSQESARVPATGTTGADGAAPTAPTPPVTSTPSTDTPPTSSPAASVPPVDPPAAPAAPAPAADPPAAIRLPAVTTPAISVPAIATPVVNLSTITVPSVKIDSALP